MVTIFSKGNGAGSALDQNGQCRQRKVALVGNFKTSENGAPPAKNPALNNNNEKNMQASNLLKSPIDLSSLTPAYSFNLFLAFFPSA